MLTSLVALAAHRPPTRTGDALAFYGVAATIIPVLFLGIAFQANAIDPKDWPIGSLAIAASLVSFATISSEAAAVRVLALQHPTHDAQTLINVCMGFLTFALLVTPVGERIFEPLLAKLKRGNESRVESGAFFMLVLIIAGAIAVAVLLA